MKNVDEAYESFKKFKSDYESYIDRDLSESDTRSKRGPLRTVVH